MQPNLAASKRQHPDTAAAEPAEPIRLQKALSRAGVASRRHAEALIDARRVEVNGRTVERQGMRVDPKSMAPLVDVAFAKGISLMASALGPPPPWLIERAKAEGEIPVAALAGSLEHAIRQVPA